jgi:aquaporin Z
MGEETEWETEQTEQEREQKIEEVPQPEVLQPPPQPQIRSIKKYTAELIGTMVLVLIGCGSAVIASIASLYLYQSSSIEPIFYLAIALAFGLAVLTMVYTIGGVSGCHINPAITISMLVAGKISVRDSVFYIIFQCIGAIIGAGILYAIASGSPSYTLATNGLGANGYGSSSILNFSLTGVFLAEVVLSFIFILVVHGATHERVPKGFAGLAIGLTLAMIHIVGIPIDGTSVNPARSLGPAIFVGGIALSQLWLFIVAPIIGGIIAAIVWRLFK